MRVGYFRLIVILLNINLLFCQNKQDNRLENITLENVTHLPDDYFFPKGDSIYMKVINKGKDITPILISKIDDTTNSNVVYADTFQYKVGDVAFFMIDDLYDDYEFPIRKMLEEEFNKEKKHYPFFHTLYHEIFFLNSEEQNLINRKRLKTRLYKWYKKIE